MTIKPLLQSAVATVRLRAKPLISATICVAALTFEPQESVLTWHTTDGGIMLYLKTSASQAPFVQGLALSHVPVAELHVLCTVVVLGSLDERRPVLQVKFAS